VVNIICYINVQVAFNMADELCDLSPPLDKDTFFDAVDVDIAYTASSAEYRDRRYQGSAVDSTDFDCWGLWSVYNFDIHFSKSSLHTVNETL